MAPGKEEGVSSTIFSDQTIPPDKVIIHISVKIPPLCTHVVGFSTKTLIPSMFTSATETFLQGVLCWNINVYSMVNQAFGANMAVMSTTGVIIGSQAGGKHPKPYWKYLVDTQKDTDLYGLPVGTCPTCGIALSASGKDGKKCLRCGKCKFRTKWCLKPDGSVSNGHFPTLFLWNWPLTPQSLGWLKPEKACHPIATVTLDI